MFQQSASLALCTLIMVALAFLTCRAACRRILALNFWGLTPKF